jgi:hypothetical protein
MGAEQAVLADHLSLERVQLFGHQEIQVRVATLDDVRREHAPAYAQLQADKEEMQDCKARPTREEAPRTLRL